MTTMTIPNTRPAKMLPPVQVAPAITIGRLTRVELRKLSDTRASRWLLAIALVGTVAAGALFLSFVDQIPGDIGWLTPMFFVSTPMNALLPVVAILAITQEWSQRTSLTTFVSEPRRGRVIASKLLATLLLTLVGAVAMVAASAATALLAEALTATPVRWAWDGPVLASAVANLAISMAVAAGLALLLMNSPAAIALFFIIPTATSALAMVPGVAGRIAQWVSGETWGLLFTPMTATQWGQAATALILWAVVPLAIGCWRSFRVEAK